MHTKKTLPPNEPGNKITAFGATWNQAQMPLLLPTTPVALNGSEADLSPTEQLQKRLLKFEQLLAQSTLHWKKFWVGQTLDIQSQLAAITNGDPGLVEKVRARLTEYEIKYAAAPTAPWCTFFLKEIELCQKRLKELEGGE